MGVQVGSFLGERMDVPSNELIHSCKGKAHFSKRGLSFDLQSSCAFDALKIH